MTTIVYIRKVYQMAVLSVILVALVTLIIILSLSASEARTIACEALQIDVEVDRPNIRVTWETHSCALAYNITHFVNGDAVSYTLIPNPVQTMTLTWHPCVTNNVVVTIVPQTNTDPVDPEMKEFVTGLRGDGVVSNLVFDEENSRFTWDAPEDSHEGCNIEYEINFESEAFKEQKIISERFYEITVYPCSSNTIDIVTLITLDNSFSSAKILSHEGSQGRKEPVHVMTDPWWFHTYVEWHIQSEPNNLCDVEAVRFEVVKVSDETDSQAFPIDFDSTVYNVEYTLISLDLETMYHHRACFTFRSSDLVICSSYIRFFTRPLEEPTVDINFEMTENLHRISWQQDYLLEFVSGNSLRIQPIGPNHFVPDECDFDLNLIEKHFGPDETSFDFKDTKPSFRYSIVVITHFESLGRTTTSEEGILISNEEAPGDLGSNAWYQYTPASPYNVALEAKWFIPCDINGKVERFAYKVTGTLISGIAAICNDITIASDNISDDLQKEEHSISIPGLLPFFEYTLTITTHLKEEYGSIVVNLGAAPEAYTPVN